MMPTLQEMVNSVATVSSSVLVTETSGQTKQPERSASPPPPPSSASSGFSDDDSLHFDDGRGITLEDFAHHVKTKGKQGLYLEYADIKSKGTDGTFNNSRCVRARLLVKNPSYGSITI